VAFASGFLTQDDPAFGVWVALPDGTTFALPEVILSTDDLGGRLAGFRLSPNPVSGQAWIDLQLNEAVDAQLQLTDLTGRVVRQIFQGQLSAGVQALSFDTQGLPAGMYLLTLRSEQGVSSLRVVVNN
ncbi:MAG: T9SS type A sorting domain-containing protein, partial [Saprospiraceae bacterium]|nr:T9SS type A sorting domain-containing protein [Saprospiraceae bacterium]